MSEIFDFLKKADAERKKMHTKAEPTVEIPLEEFVASQPQPADRPALDALNAMEDTDSPENGFDLERATYQLRSVLDPLTVVGEQFRVLRTRLNLMQKQSGIKTVLVTSAVPQEGKSFTTCGLAGVIAQELGKRVVVIDADMRKPGSGRDLCLNGNSSRVGIAQVLSREVDLRKALLKSNSREFWFLPSGDIPRNPSELLSSPAFEELLKSATALFDWVIVDSPPIFALSDAGLIAPLCETVLLVVRANSTPTKLIKESIDRIGREKICGIVLNRQQQVLPSRYYYQYYYRKSKKGGS